MASPTIVSLDYSAVVIEKMQARYQGTPGLEWVVQDMRALPHSFGAGSFDLVVDKAGTDGAFSFVELSTSFRSTDPIRFNYFT